jgi:hypothetical protein
VTHPQWDVRADHGRRRSPRARLGPARRHQDLAGRRLPAPARRRDDAQPERRRTITTRTSRSRWAPACSWTASTSRTTRCSWAAPSPTRTRSATAWAQLPAAPGQPAEGRGREGAHEPARRADVVRRRPRAGPEPARELRALAAPADCTRRSGSRTIRRRSAGSSPRACWSGGTTTPRHAPATAP